MAPVSAVGSGATGGRHRDPRRDQVVGGADHEPSSWRRSHPIAATSDVDGRGSGARVGRSGPPPPGPTPRRRHQGLRWPSSPAPSRQWSDYRRTLDYRPRSLGRRRCAVESPTDCFSGGLSAASPSTATPRTTPTVSHPTRSRADRVAPGSASGLENHSTPLFQFLGRSFSSRPLSRTPRERPCPAWRFLGGPSASAPQQDPRPDRSRRPGRDRERPPVYRTPFGTRVPPSSHLISGFGGGVAPGRIDPCGKARRQTEPPSAARAVPGTWAVRSQASGERGTQYSAHASMTSRRRSSRSDRAYAASA